MMTERAWGNRGNRDQDGNREDGNHAMLPNQQDRTRDRHTWRRSEFWKQMRGRRMSLLKLKQCKRACQFWNLSDAWLMWCQETLNKLHNARLYCFNFKSDMRLPRICFQNSDVLHLFPSWNRVCWFTRMRIRMSSCRLRRLVRIIRMSSCRLRRLLAHNHAFGTSEIFQFLQKLMFWSSNSNYIFWTSWIELTLLEQREWQIKSFSRLLTLLATQI